MGVDPADGESLIALLSHQFEAVVGKVSIAAVTSIAAVIVLNPDTVHGSKLLKCLFGVNGFQ